LSYRAVPIPDSRLAFVAQRLALAAIAFMLVGILAVRSGKAEPAVGIVVIVIAVVMAAAAVAVGAVSWLEIWRFGHRGFGRAFWAMILAGALLAYPGLLAIRALSLPILNDISTDLDDPPVFSSSKGAMAARGGHVPPDIDRRRRAAQERAYPAIRTLVLDSEPEEAFQNVVRAIRLLKWRVIEEIRPDDRRGLGRIEAIDESRLMRLPDDITIRLRAGTSGTRVDIRSASRFGRHDLGANARRIERLAQEITSPSD